MYIYLRNIYELLMIEYLYILHVMFILDVCVWCVWMWVPVATYRCFKHKQIYMEKICVGYDKLSVLYHLNYNYWMSENVKMNEFSSVGPV